jgi:hypothetical protein
MGGVQYSAVLLSKSSTARHDACMLLPSVSTGSSILTMNGYQECCDDNNAMLSKALSVQRRKRKTKDF